LDKIKIGRKWPVLEEVKCRRECYRLEKVFENVVGRIGLDRLTPLRKSGFQQESQEKKKSNYKKRTAKNAKSFRSFFVYSVFMVSCEIGANVKSGNTVQHKTNLEQGIV